jgi:hypothetical protein
MSGSLKYWASSIQHFDLRFLSQVKIIIYLYIYGLKNIPAFVWFGSTGINQVAGFHLALMLIVVGTVKPAGRFRELSVLMLDHWTGYVQHPQVLVLA